MASASRLLLEKRLLPNDSVGGTSGMFALLTKDELKELRSVKGDRGRRAHVDAMLPQLPSERLCMIGQEWGYLNELGREDLPELEIMAWAVVLE